MRLLVIISLILFIPMTYASSTSCKNNTTANTAANLIYDHFHGTDYSLAWAGKLKNALASCSTLSNCKGSDLEKAVCSSQGSTTDNQNCLKQKESSFCDECVGLHNTLSLLIKYNCKTSTQSSNCRASGWMFPSDVSYMGRYLQPCMSK